MLEIKCKIKRMSTKLNDLSLVDEIKFNSTIKMTLNKLVINIPKRKKKSSFHLGWNGIAISFFNIIMALTKLGQL